MSTRDKVRLAHQHYPYSFVDEWDNYWRPEVDRGSPWPTLAMVFIAIVAALIVTHGG